MGVVYIYGLIDPRNNQIFYVGYTNNTRTRLNSHIKNKYNYDKDIIIENIINDKQKPILKIIDKCNRVYNYEENMFEHERLEIYYIKKYRELGYNLSNMTDGGGDTVSYLKKKICKYDQFGKFIKEYESISEAGIKHNINPDNIGHAVDQRIKKSSCGYYWFTSHEKAKGFTFKIIAKNNLSVLQYSLTNEFICEFNGKKEVYESFNIQRKSIKEGYSLLTRALKSNGNKSTLGYLWYYKGNEPKNN
jgi:hypothetical protein